MYWPLPETWSSESGAVVGAQPREPLGWRQSWGVCSGRPSGGAPTDRHADFTTPVQGFGGLVPRNGLTRFPLSLSTI